jgi:hypothetical protein
MSEYLDWFCSLVNSDWGRKGLWRSSVVSAPCLSQSRSPDRISAGGTLGELFAELSAFNRFVQSAKKINIQDPFARLR